MEKKEKEAIKQLMGSFFEGYENLEKMQKLMDDENLSSALVKQAIQKNFPHLMKYEERYRKIIQEPELYKNDPLFQKLEDLKCYFFNNKESELLNEFEMLRKNMREKVS